MSYGYRTGREVTAAQAKLPRVVLWRADPHDYEVKRGLFLVDPRGLLRLQEGRVHLAGSLEELTQARGEHGERGPWWHRTEAGALAVAVRGRKARIAELKAKLCKAEKAHARIVQQLAAARKAGP